MGNGGKMAWTLPHWGPDPLETGLPLWDSRIDKQWRIDRERLAVSPPL